MTPQADPIETGSLTAGPLTPASDRSGERAGTPTASAVPAATLLTIDVLDPDTGMAEVEDDQGRNFELPAAWLPGAAEGLAYHALPHAGGVSFTLLVGGARELRERSKQTLLDFSDEHADVAGADRERGGQQGEDGLDNRPQGTLEER